MSNFKTLRTILNGKDVMVGMWRSPTGGVFEMPRKIAEEALNAVSGHEQRSNKIRSDSRLSETAMREDVLIAAEQGLKKLGGLHAHLQQESAALDLRAGRLTAVTPYRDGDASTIQIDLELARVMRGMDDAKRGAVLTQVGDNRLRDAALRLPSILTGVTDTQKARIEREAIEQQNPIEAQEIDDLRTAMRDAQDAVNKAWKVLSPGVPIEGQYVAAGDPEAAKELLKSVPSIVIENIQARLEAS